MATKMVRVGQKRRIEKVWGVFNDTATTSNGNIVLHTCEDSKTLVRVVIKIDSVLGSGSPTYNYVIARAPGGTTVTTSTTGNSLDNDAINEFIAHVSGLILTGSTETLTDSMDLKSMRKLQVGDTIVLQHKSNVSGGVVFSGSYTLFFKE